MSEQKRIATRLQKVRRELDELAEHLERLARDVEGPEPERPEIVGITEIATMLDKPTMTVTNYRRHGKLPEPLAELACGPVWLKREIELWAEWQDAA